MVASGPTIDFKLISAGTITVEKIAPAPASHSDEPPQAPPLSDEALIDQVRRLLVDCELTMQGIARPETPGAARLALAHIVARGQRLRGDQPWDTDELTTFVRSVTHTQLERLHAKAREAEAAAIAESDMDERGLVSWRIPKHVLDHERQHKRGIQRAIFQTEKELLAQRQHRALEEARRRQEELNALGPQAGTW